VRGDCIPRTQGAKIRICLMRKDFDTGLAVA
jgi:hypothetical protein